MRPGDCLGGTCVAGDADSSFAGPAAIAVTAAGRSAAVRPRDQRRAPATAGSAPASTTSTRTTARAGRRAARRPSRTSPRCRRRTTTTPTASSEDREPCTCNRRRISALGVDAAGNLLLPVSWQSMLVPGSVPMPRLLRTRFLSPLPFTLPDAVFIGSFTPEGGKLPPIFEPQIDPSVANPDVVSLFGSVDAPYTILRIGRRFGTCQGGGNDGERCNVNDDCPGGAVRRRCVGAPTTLCTTDAECGGNGPAARCSTSPPRSTTVRSCCRARRSPRRSRSPACARRPPRRALASCGGDGPCVNYAFEAKTPVTSTRSARRRRRSGASRPSRRSSAQT